MPRVKLFDQQEVLERAVELFWKQGYYATSMQELVDHLGINRGSLYDTFGGKRQLFDRAFQHYRQTNTEKVKEFFSQQQDVRSGLRNFFARALEQSCSDTDRKGCFVVNSITEFTPGDAEMTAIFQQNERVFEDIFYEYLKQGAARGEIGADKDLRAIAQLIFTFYNGLKVVMKVNTDAEKMQQSVTAFLKILD